MTFVTWCPSSYAGAHCIRLAGHKAPWEHTDGRGLTWSPTAKEHAMTDPLTDPITAPGRHPATVDLIRWFSHSHLREGLPKRISAQISALACELIDSLPDGPELSAGLRKLLEAKDCMVRAAHAATPPTFAEDVAQ